jgi:cell division protease FtsH
MKGREQIFKVHSKTIKLGPKVDVYKLASLTPGFVGADIANICNEAALIAARHNKTEIDMQDFNDAIDRAIGGLEKKNKLISPDEKKIIAYHEAGHAISGWFLENAHPLLKVSIIPRGVAALGYAQYLPKEKYIERDEEMLDRMCMTLSGRAAERIVFDKISTGAQNDLDHVTKVAYAMVSVFGMNKKVGNVSFYDMQNQNSFNKPFSEETSKIIDEEARKIIEEQYVRAQELLRSKRTELDALANLLLEKEVLFKDDLERLIGKRPFDKQDGIFDTPNVDGEFTVSTNGDVNPASVENGKL